MQFPAQGRNTGGHVLFCIHIDTIRAIAEAAAQPQNPDAFELQDFSIRAQAAFRRFLFIVVVMVPVYVDDRGVGKAGQERQVGRRKIPCGEDQIHAGKGLPALSAPQLSGGFV